MKRKDKIAGRSLLLLRAPVMTAGNYILTISIQVPVVSGFKAIGAVVFGFLILVAATAQQLARTRTGVQSIPPNSVFEASHSSAANIAQSKVVNAKF